MDFDIVRQDSYSRGELLLRTFFGGLYIAAPHLIVLMFLAIWSSIVSFIAWWSILFTGRYPQSFFEFQTKMLSWNMRLSASLGNLIDGYPAIGLSASHPAVRVNIPQPESLSRGKLLLRTFFGLFYVIIPHGICLYGRMIATGFLQMLSWFSILFTGSIPEGWFKFNVGTLRWSLRLNLYMANMTDTYPPFSGLPAAH
jgi:hypothetical protein